MEKITRRNFLKGAAIAATQSTLLGSLAFASEPETYEYIVVGSGAGGGPVCANLARAGYKVLLLEAGGRQQTSKYTVPAFQGLATEDPTMQWNFFVKHYGDPNRAKQDSKYVMNKGVLYPRAGTLGGCTSHNAMITMYPDNSDWENIAEQTGDKSWHAENLRPYFQRVENARYMSDKKAAAQLHGKNGWLQVEQTSPSLVLRDPALLRLVLTAAKAANLPASLIERIALLDPTGLKELLDLDTNDWEGVVERREGLFNVPKATSQGKRNGTRELILSTKVRFPKNLTIRLNALASKVVFDETKRAIGVEYLEGSHLYEADPASSALTRMAGAKKFVRATREVILAGGAFNTPQLLLLSGVGPAEELARHDIRPVVELPGVGKNLQDRYEVGVITRMKEPLHLLKGLTFGRTANDPGMRDYVRDPENSIYGSNGVIIGLKKRSSQKQPDPDLFIFAAPGAFKGYYPGWSTDALQSDCATWAILKGKTENTAGSVTLKSSDPTASPEINFRYFTEGNDAAGTDLDAMVNAVKFVRGMNKGLSTYAKSEVVPGPRVNSDDEIREFVQREAWGHHASCSNRMGRKNDPMAVVDSEFNVLGTRGLRIVDASVFPRIPGLFIVVPVYMIAEKASDVILRDAKA